MSEREATGDMAGVRRVFLDGTRAVLYLVLPIHLGLLAFGRPFLARWVGGAEYADSCFPTTAILSATLTVGVAQSVASRILYGTGRLRLFARLALLEAALNLALSLALVGPYGLEGVAAAVAGPNVLFCVVTIAYAASVLEVGAGTYLRRAWLRPLLAALAPAAVWWALPPAAATWAAIAAGIATGLAPYVVAVGVLGLLTRKWGGVPGSGTAVPGLAVATRVAPPVAPSLPRATARG